MIKGAVRACYRFRLGAIYSDFSELVYIISDISELVKPFLIIFSDFSEYFFMS